MIASGHRGDLLFEPLARARHDECTLKMHLDVSVQVTLIRGLFDESVECGFNHVYLAMALMSPLLAQRSCATLSAQPSDMWVLCRPKARCSLHS